MNKLTRRYKLQLAGVLVASCILSALIFSNSPLQRAKRLKPGMSQTEVQQRKGLPSSRSAHPTKPGWTIWIYNYDQFSVRRLLQRREPMINHAIVVTFDDTQKIRSVSLGTYDFMPGVLIPSTNSPLGATDGIK